MPLNSLRFKFIVFFSIAVVFVFILWYQIGNLVDERQNEKLKNDIFVFVQAILPSYTVGNFMSVDSVVKKFGYQVIDNIPSKVQTLYLKEDGILKIFIFQSSDYVGFLLQYFDDRFIAVKKIEFNFWEEYRLQILLLPIVFVLVVLQVILYAILNPLSRVSKALKEVMRGNYEFNFKIKRNDEIGDLMRLFLQAQQVVSRMLKSRELILRSLGHELRTPLAKMKLTLALKKKLAPEDIKLKKYVKELQKISDNILEFERIHNGDILLDNKEFSSKMLLLEALSGFEDEENRIFIDIKEDFIIKSDLRLLSVAVKNLIENALKYSNDSQVNIKVFDENIYVTNKGEPLKYDISYYLEPFYRDMKHQAIQGYGLGLSIISEITKILKISLEYQYIKQEHCFFLNFKGMIKNIRKSK